MASVRPPPPCYRPLLPKRLLQDGLLSDAQIETVIYAGEARAELLAGRYRVDESLDNLSLAKDDDAAAVQFRKGFFLGDGTGLLGRSPQGDADRGDLEATQLWSHAGRLVLQASIRERRGPNVRD
jgi:hypothetical protein